MNGNLSLVYNYKEILFFPVSVDICFHLELNSSHIDSLILIYRIQKMAEPTPVIPATEGAAATEVPAAEGGVAAEAAPVTYLDAVTGE